MSYGTHIGKLLEVTFVGWFEPHDMVHLVSRATEK